MKKPSRSAVECHRLADALREHDEAVVIAVIKDAWRVAVRMREDRDRLALDLLRLFMEWTNTTDEEAPNG